MTHEYKQDGRYGDGHYRGYRISPDIDEEGEIQGYFISMPNTELHMQARTRKEAIQMIDVREDKK